MGFIKESNRSRVLIIYFLISSMLEILAYAAGGVFETLAAWVWLCTAVILGILFLYHTGKQAYRDIKGKKYFVSFGFLVLVILFFSFIGNIGYADINPDATQQTAAGLDSFSNAGLNYTGKAFLGYPVRQYTIAAIPALLFGRSVWTLHAGFGFYFIVGLVVFFLGLRSWLRSKDIKEEYALLPCFSLLCFPFISEYYQNFEQAIIPVSLTMLAIGLYLKLLLNTDMKLYIAIVWTGCLMADSYTPVLASMGLLMVFILLLNKYKPATIKAETSKAVITAQDTDYSDEMLRDIPEKKQTSDTDELITRGEERKQSHKAMNISLEMMVPVGAVFNIIVFFLATFIPGRSDRLTEFREEGSLLDSIFTSWTDFFTDTNARFLGLFGGVVLLYIIFSIAGAFKLHDALLSLWVLAVVFISDYMTGYTAYEKGWILQRNMIVIPVLLTGIFIVLMYFLKKHELKIPVFIQGIVLTLMLFAGLFNFSQQHRSFNYFRFIQPMKHLIAYVGDTLDDQGLKVTDEFNLVVYTDNILEQNMFDYAKFFYPNAKVYIGMENIYPEIEDEELITFIYADDTRLDRLIPESDPSPGYIKMMDAVTYKRESYNKRYKFTAEWYRKIVNLK
ncbi:MAG: hypothetical protein IK014_12385 [Lachnospiraceae bacterium]|nr:hypothetical protein [Lachnospiraceae bacterium]